MSPFGNTGTLTRTATADVDGDGVADLVAATGPGTPLRVAVLSGSNGSVLVAPFDPFGGDFPGGGFVAAADLDGDGRAEFAVTPDQGGGPRVTILSLTGGRAAVRANIFGIDDPAFRGGARAALGDVDGDGTADVVVAAGFGGGPRVTIFTGASILAGAPARLVGHSFALPGSDAATLRNGAFAAVGDVDGDGKADLVFGGGPGGGPRVFVLSGALVAAGRVDAAYAAPVANFFVGGDASGRGGPRVAATNVDGDGRADVALGSGAGEPARVRVYRGATFTGGPPGLPRRQRHDPPAPVHRGEPERAPPGVRPEPGEQRPPRPPQPGRPGPGAAGERALDPDERRPVAAAVVVEPVGQDQPRQVVGRGGEDGGQEGGVVAHVSLRPRPGGPAGSGVSDAAAGVLQPPARHPTPGVSRVAARYTCSILRNRQVAARDRPRGREHRRAGVGGP